MGTPLLNSKKPQKPALQILEEAILDFWDIVPYQDIISWSEENIDFSEDISAERSQLDFSLTPHIVEPLKQWQFDGKIREVQIIGIEQHGKTLCSVVGLLYSLVYKPCQMMVVYPSDELAADTNQSKYEPLITKIPLLAKQLEAPHSKRSDRYAFSNSTIFFQGAGRKIVSKSCKIRIADELSAWKPIGFDNFEDLKKRGRSYSESLLYSVTSVRYESDKAWQNFLAGSQGYWTLRCKSCGKLTMRSCDLHNLQFETSYNEQAKQYEVIPDSIRLICPECKHEHIEEDKFQMNREGGYVHRFPERIDETPSFQFGVLCSLFPFMSWKRIATKCLSSGKTAEIEMLEQFDNSWRGLPFKRREVSLQDLNNIKSHCGKPPKPEDVEFIFATADTQDNFSPAAMWAVDKNDNLYMLEHKDFQFISLLPEDREKVDMRKKAANEPPSECLQDWLSYCWNGFSPLFMVVDRKGHRTAEIEAFAKRYKQVFQYAGTSLKYDKFKIQDRQRRIIYVAARQYQADLIYYLYNQKNREQNYLYLPETVSDRVIKQITVVQPDKTKKNGHFPQNWQPEHQAVHDYFDVAKMAVFGKQFAIKTLSKSHFKLCEAPSIRRRFNTKKLDETTKEKAGGKSSSWLNSYK